MFKNYSCCSMLWYLLKCSVKSTFISSFIISWASVLSRFVLMNTAATCEHACTGLCEHRLPMLFVSIPCHGVAALFGNT